MKAASRRVQIPGEQNARCKGSDYGGNGDTGGGCTVAGVVYDFGVLIVISSCQVNFMLGFSVLPSTPEGNRRVLSWRSL